MIVDKDKLVKSIEEAIKNGKKRRFVETVEMAVNLRNVDMKKPENRIDTVVNLPHGLGKPRKIGVFAKGDTALKAKEAGADVVITPEEIDELAKDKRRAKKLANSIDFFIAEAPLMPEIGRKLGPVLGPRGKIPQPIPPLADPKPFIDRLRNSVKIRTRDKTTFHAPIGSENMDVEKIAENAMEILKVVENKYENPTQVVKSVYVKKTMGPAVRVV
ncbi:MULTISPECIES: 50S ribosomal protein L1 [Archaeoglobus]|jgi:large subunit ribosomal protein L1|uniref:Large ribosomal subunit protein uL1 n=3 Tax=Archaeoglobus fulgidus TaxID=2234 RepID=RL1_ARCFU|nr:MULTISPECIES: 50S ribosomal protein L1 [Archaeoglobus]O28782.1 RecName: Full=Large ribosomal subunit protein uL1; AltName: Full=50S ribosomal protein L1 [Archaeoglobus fulgidus DSM 4304]AAB89750.1 LSU ribosomal protein L1P (rpl1P) [Archaeoglobus fulgidus DSM 4304]AIG98500.1 Ribosomal protein L1 [Archaeoglobus fulgidus DSM 8774]KUJ94244.1 MAG: 50S ribosomal protein L1 [Archaeoglobus fulgidus]KUK06767.1 MAG: 50S ribosomal protein L1 [Archaeoglobus fulgidus]MDI3497754.1 large subunit ribosoma